MTRPEGVKKRAERGDRVVAEVRIAIDRAETLRDPDAEFAAVPTVTLKAILRGDWQR